MSAGLKGSAKFEVDMSLFHDRLKLMGKPSKKMLRPTPEKTGMTR